MFLVFKSAQYYRANPSSKTRDLALSLIQSGEDIENGISLLAKNLLPKDEVLFYNTVKSFPIRHNEWNWHSVFKAVEDGIKTMRGFAECITL